MSLFSSLLTGPGGATTFRHPDNQTVTSAFDGQSFVINKGDAVLVDGDPVLTIDDDRVSFTIRGTAETTGETATLDIQGDKADIDVQRYGEILAEDTGIEISGARADIANRGEISGDINAVYLTSSSRDAVVNNQVSGVISSDSRAVNIDGDGAKLNNFGQIIGTGDQRNGVVYANRTAEDFTINNFLTASIDAGKGNDGAAVSLQIGNFNGDVVEGELTNRGTIIGRGDGEGNLTGDGVRIFSGVDGGTTTFQGTIFNGRAQSTTSKGQTIEGQPGEIVSEKASGIIVQEGVNFVGEIENRGEISGGVNGIFFSDGDHNAQINNQARGVITSDSRGVNIDGDGVTLNNRGDILGTDDQRNGTVYVNGTAENFEINNFSNARIDVGEGNQGAGVSLQIGDEFGDVVVGSLTNFGVIAGRGDGSGSLAGDGIRVFTGAPEGGTTLQGDITNHGLVESGDDGIELNRGLTLRGDILNYGRIDSNEDGIDLDPGATLQGNLVNKDRIDAANDGIDLDPFSTITGDITNDGTINADDNGIDINADVTIGGTILNRGTITGDADGDDDGLAIGARRATNDLTVENEGTLNGDVVLGSGDDSFDSSEGTVNGQVFGNGGEDRIITGAGSDTLDGGSGNDSLTGGSGDDTFVFLTGTDEDTVTDFENDADLLDVSAFFDTAADAVAAARQDNADTVIDLDVAGGDSVRLTGVNVAQIDETDFIV